MKLTRILLAGVTAFAPLCHAYADQSKRDLAGVRLGQTVIEAVTAMEAADWGGISVTVQHPARQMQSGAIPGIGSYELGQPGRPVCNPSTLEIFGPGWRCENGLGDEKLGDFCIVARIDLDHHVIGFNCDNVADNTVISATARKRDTSLKFLATETSPNVVYSVEYNSCTTSTPQDVFAKVSEDFGVNISSACWEGNTTPIPTPYGTYTTCKWRPTHTSLDDHTILEIEIGSENPTCGNPVTVTLTDTALQNRDKVAKKKAFEEAHPMPKF
jgi:hypothetical protein